ncbi:polyphosphate kinase 1 [Microbulbifer epialgicus]|uniref:Polyphosphate kinase n=1 Tax=Microbulbifer epialgicus TaxID=393907 RepID=A0ABV4NZI9_9GAMM
MLRLPMFNDMPLYPKELSWLSFNERVLQEVEDETVPIIERMRFLGIFSNNLDEFFRVRVADVRRLAAFARGEQQKKDFAKLLSQINERVLRLQRRYARAYAKVLKDLDKHNIHVVRESRLSVRQRSFVEDYFHREVLPELEPFFIDDRETMPLLNEASIYFAIFLRLKNGTQRYAAMEIPTNTLPRFVVIPPREGKREKVYIVLDNIIRACLVEVFRQVLQIHSAQAYMFKISRDAELELGEQITQNLVDRMEKSLKRRKRADPVRLAYDAEMPQVLLNIVKKKLKMGRYDTYTPGGRYHNSKDLMKFPADSARYTYKPLVPLSTLPSNGGAFAQIRSADRLFYYPYHDFRVITNLLASAAIDSQVREIRINLYRVAKNSRVVAALINAVRNNKKVVAVVELRARFDELANIHWSKELSDAGVQVIYGVPRLKVHCKLISIIRREEGKDRFYSHLGTGNFNENTAKIYCDFSLLTNNQELGLDVYNVFEFIQFTRRRPVFQHIAVSPLTNRAALLGAIDREIEAAKQGHDAALFFKCNNLVDGQMISRLYCASAAGVKVRIIVRSMCSLVCETPGLSDNIQVISLVDKYLEHARVYIFHNAGEELMWLSSADLMTRNLDYRIEVTFPLTNSEHRRTIRKILEFQWSDNQKARIMDAKQSNRRIANNSLRGCRAQDAIYRYLKQSSVN